MADTDFMCVCSADGFSKIPEPARREWQSFLTEVDSLLKKAESGLPRP
jgi:hypothetical protein